MYKRNIYIYIHIYIHRERERERNITLTHLAPTASNPQIPHPKAPRTTLGFSRVTESPFPPRILSSVFVHATRRGRFPPESHMLHTRERNCCPPELVEDSSTDSPPPHHAEKNKTHAVKHVRACTHVYRPMASMTAAALTLPVPCKDS